MEQGEQQLIEGVADVALEKATEQLSQALSDAEYWNDKKKHATTVSKVMDARACYYRVTAAIEKTRAMSADTSGIFITMDRSGEKPDCYAIREFQKMDRQQQREAAVYAGYENGLRIHENILNVRLADEPDEEQGASPFDEADLVPFSPEDIPGEDG